MKLKYLFVILLFLPGTLFSQEKKNLVKTSLVAPFGESFLLSYERMLGDESSIGVEGMVGTGNSIRAEYRYYMSEEKIAPNGAFIAPYVHLMDENGLGGGVLIGVQRLFKSKIALEAFIGPGIYTEGVSAWGGVNVGFAF